LIFIGIIFMSFSTSGMRAIPVGMVVADGITIDEYTNELKDFLIIEQYASLDTCFKDMKMYHQYLCIEVVPGESILLNMYYDNTVNDLRQAQFQLRRDLEDVDSDIADVRRTKEDLEDVEQDMYGELNGNLNEVEDNLDDIPTNNVSHYFVSEAEDEVDRAQSELNNYHNMANSEFYQLTTKINSYQAKSDNAKEMTEEMDTYVDTLEETKDDLRVYQKEIIYAKKEIETIKSDFSLLTTVNADSLVNPIVVSGIPLYLAQNNAKVADTLGSDYNTKDAIKGLNLISMQTMFPRIVLLITLFLSLLIAVYICLEQVNSPANARIKLVKHIFIPEFVSLFFSTIIILIIPVIIILLLGELVFLLPIFKHFGSLGLVLLLECSAFILLGILLGYLVKKESIALLVSSFVLVTIIFFSGFLYPIERMSVGAATIAANSPGAVAMNSFYKLVFYEQGFASVSGEISTLLMWCCGLIALSLVVKALRRA